MYIVDSLFTCIGNEAFALKAMPRAKRQRVGARTLQLTCKLCKTVCLQAGFLAPNFFGGNANVLAPNGLLPNVIIRLRPDCLCANSPPNSSKHLACVLYARLRLTVSEQTDGSVSKSMVFSYRLLLYRKANFFVVLAWLGVASGGPPPLPRVDRGIS